MAVNKFTSVNTVIAKIIRDIGSSNIEGDFASIKEWIAEPLIACGSYQTTIKVVEELHVSDYKAIMPCAILELLAVVDSYGCRIPHQTGHVVKGFHPKANKEKIAITNAAIVVTVDEEGNKVRSQYNPAWFNEQPTAFNANYLNGVQNRQHYYYLNNEIINVSFEEGRIFIVYRTYELDDDGFPLIPDNTYLREAIYYWVLYKMMGRGFQHMMFKNWQDVLALYRDYIAKAKASINYPSDDQYSEWLLNRMKAIPDLHYWHRLNQ